MSETQKLFLNKTVKLRISGDNGRQLIFTAKILEYDNEKIVFLDKFGSVYQFKTELLQEIKTINEDDK